LTPATEVSQQVRHLARPPLQHLPQQQHGPLPGREVLQGGDEREPDGGPRGDGGGGVGAGGEVDGAVGHRLQPGDLRSVRSGSSGSVLAPSSPAGVGRRVRPSSAVRQVVVTIRCSQVRSEDRPSKRS
jgi:hypothetical protein